ncbi:hypothetical protein [Paenibacillus sp. OV219]|uniref:hypothetical protein n=1 Tax=Paenibacillus sp. OV219 TaxID=1884377 RepID=UPI0008C07587|nr:hypothetical protein [Paenibacillus sp. OV219]SEO16629.1 hypothetical protein SAMN05518847_106128 [Paenibacillus sp. OV219]
METNTGYETRSAASYERNRQTRKKGLSVPLFLFIWVLLIGSGLLGTIWYAGKLKQNLTDQVNLQTAQQITAMQADYKKQLDELTTNFNGELGKIQSKVDALNELLEFSKDNMSSKTDNSNKLYSQIAEVKKQLNELKKSLDVLK